MSPRGVCGREGPTGGVLALRFPSNVAEGLVPRDREGDDELPLDPIEKPAFIRDRPSSPLDP